MGGVAPTVGRVGERPVAARAGAGVTEPIAITDPADLDLVWHSATTGEPVTLSTGQLVTVVDHRAVPSWA